MNFKQKSLFKKPQVCNQFINMDGFCFHLLKLLRVVTPGSESERWIIA